MPTQGDWTIAVYRKKGFLRFQNRLNNVLFRTSGHECRYVF